MTSTTVTTTLNIYQPTIDVATISVQEALGLVHLLQSVSTIINAAIDHDNPSPVAQYLDDWQALLSAATFNIADVVQEMRPSTRGEQCARNWLLATVKLACSEGFVDLTGTGADEYDDEFSRGLVAAQPRQKKSGSAK